MKTSIFAAMALSASLAFSATTSFAASTDFTDNNTYTTDTISGLDWLDVTISAGQSYNYVSSQFGSGGEYEGYQYATGSQVNQLVSNWTGNNIAPTNYGVVVHVEDLIDGLVLMLGDTYSNYFAVNGGLPRQGLQYTFGITAGVQSASAQYLAMIWNDDYSEEVDWSSAQWASLNRDLEQMAHIGSFLVRESGLIATPIPAAAFMFAPALLGFLGFRRKLRA